MSLNPKAREAFILLFDGDEEKADKWLEENTDPTNRQISDEELVARAKAEKEAKEKAEKEKAEKAARDKADNDNLDPEADASDADPDAEPGEADSDDDDDDSDADDNDKEFVIDEELIPVLQEAILDDKRFEALFQVPGMVVKLAEQIDEITKTASAFEKRVAAVERSDEEKQGAWSKDLGKKARQVIGVTYRRKEADDDDGDDDEETTDTAEHVKEILKDVPQYGPDTPLKNMPQ